MEDELKVKYNANCTQVYLGMQTEDDSAENEDKQPKESKEKDPTNSHPHYVQYSEYNLLLHKVNDLQSENAKLANKVKQLNDEIEAIHSQLNYLLEKFDKNTQ